MSARMRILIFHGYLLRGTGSNIYNASLVRALVRLGHEVHLLCQDRHAGELGFVDATASWSGGGPQNAPLREPPPRTPFVPGSGGGPPGFRPGPPPGVPAG